MDDKFWDILEASVNSSLMVPRRLRLVTCREASGCPNNGSKINGLDCASKAFLSPKCE